MAVVQLPFGREKISLNIPDSRLNGLLMSGAHSYQADGGEEELVRKAMEHPIHSPRLKELVKGKKNIVMIASDHTRPVPSRVIAPAVIKEIKEGNPQAQLTILIATGFHRSTTREELIDKFGQEIAGRTDIRFVVHESRKDEDMVFIDTLPSGGKLLINRIAAEADLLISEGFIEPHFFCRLFRR
jgi:nickel-dependent lactate racemase